MVLSITLDGPGCDTLDLSKMISVDKVGRLAGDKHDKRRPACASIGWILVGSKQ